MKFLSLNIVNTLVQTHNRDICIVGIRYYDYDELLCVLLFLLLLIRNVVRLHSTSNTIYYKFQRS